MRREREGGREGERERERERGKECGGILHWLWHFALFQYPSVFVVVVVLLSLSCSSSSEPTSVCPNCQNRIFAEGRTGKPGLTERQG
jgi:hypothetical protein